MAVNNLSRNSMMSNTINKVKSNWAAITLVLLLVGVIASYYFISNANREGFSDESEASGALIGAPPNLKPKSGECIVALFYADWCPHCVEFKPKFKEAMKKMDGQMWKKGKKLKFVLVDCDEYKELAKEFDVSGYPTVKIIDGEGVGKEYNGERTFEGLQKYFMSDN
jgi:thiol-disulfide isomerase/thioredoxin